MTQPVHVQMNLVISTSMVWPGHREQCPASKERPCCVYSCPLASLSLTNRWHNFVTAAEYWGSCLDSLGNFAKTLWELMVGKGA